MDQYGTMDSVGMQVTADNISGLVMDDDEVGLLE
jgi:hypothetical protein